MAESRTAARQAGVRADRAAANRTMEQNRQRIAERRAFEEEHERTTVHFADGSSAHIQVPVGTPRDSIVNGLIQDGIMTTQDVEADLNRQMAKEVGVGEAITLSAGGILNTAFDRGRVAAASLEETFEGSAGGLERRGPLDADPGKLRQARENIAFQEGVIAPVRAERPFSVGIGESLPASAIPGGPFAQTLAAVAEGVLLNPETPIAGGISTGLFSFGGQRAGQRVSQEFNKRLAPALSSVAERTGSREVQQAANRAFIRGEGVPTTRTQRGGLTGRLIEAGLQSIPGVASISAATARRQAAKVNRNFANMFGFDFDNLLTPRLRQIDKQFGIDYATVENSITPTALPDRLIEVIDDFNLLTTGERATIDLAEPLAGRELLRVRRAINDQLARDASAGNTIAVNQLRDAMELTETLVDDAMPDGEMRQLFRDTNRRYKIWAAARRGKAISNEGNINVQTFVNNLEKSYAGFDVGRDLPGDQVDFGKLLRAISELPDPLPSSGSAERAGMAALLSGAPAALGGGMLNPAAVGAVGAGVAVPTLLALFESQKPGALAGGLLGRSISGMSNDQVADAVKALKPEERASLVELLTEGAQ